MVLLAASGFYLQITAVCLLNQQPFSYILIFLLLIVLILLICRRTSLKGTLLSDIAMGQAAKMKLTNILLGYAGTYTKKPVTFRARPWLFRNSNLIFRQRTPENGLVELCLKSTLRHTANVMFYLQVIVVYALFLSVFPPIWKWVLWGASIFILTSYVKLHWLESINSPYVALFPLRNETKRGAASRSLFIMALPGEIILALFVVMQTQEWLYALMILPAGFFLSRFTARRLA